MPWNDVSATERELSDALNAFDWGTVAKTISSVVDRMRSEPRQLPLLPVNRMLRRLRRKRQYGPLQLLAEQVIDEERATGEVRRLYAQALIDENRLPRAEKELAEVLGNSQRTEKDDTEATGLFGRVYKQRYVSAALVGSTPDPGHLSQSIQHYWNTYRHNRKANFWHGINVVALLMRAAADKVPVPSDCEPAGAIAKEILATLEATEADRDLSAFEIATAMEARVALGELEQAESRALEYASSFDADAFEVFSTQRQLREVWRLETSAEPAHKRLLSILDAALLRRQGGETRLDPAEAGRRLEENYGSDRFNTVAWYQDGLERCRSIARITGPGGSGKGTAWLVNSQDFFPSQPRRLLLLTNAHVINDSGWKNALAANEATAHFQMAAAKLRITREVWSRPELDATFVELEGMFPDATALPIYSRKVRMLMPPPRVYIIGHPEGGDLMFSLQDSLVAQCADDYLHYRTPTKGGSSGSPVFEAMGWRVVALHHAAVDTISANEGIPITRIQEAAAANATAATS